MPQNGQLTVIVMVLRNASYSLHGTVGSW